MIIIFSEKSDIVTDLVIEWLVSSKKKFIRFNDDDFVNNISDVLLNESINKIWQRRGIINVIPKFIVNQNFPNRFSFLNYLDKEKNVYSMYLEYTLKKRLKNNYIGSFEKELFTNNKLINLEIAHDIGFKIPKTIITSNKKELIRFYKKNKKIITKDLKNPVNIQTINKQFLSTGVQLVNKKMLSNLKEIFFPIFSQEYIQKKYEVRVFVFEKLIYSMAIFSQNDIQTKIDYRNYNNIKPNRCVPVKLPKNIKLGILKFMKKADMNTGSIDLIVTPKNEYYFLEINPMGQFHWISANCNFYIEKKIAKILGHEEN